MDIPALGRDSVIFESFSFISALDSIMDSIDSSQIPVHVLIGRSQRRRPEGAEAEEHPPRRLFPGWGSRGRAFNSRLLRLAGQMDRSRDADADQCAIGDEPVLLSTVSPHGDGQAPNNTLTYYSALLLHERTLAC